MTMAARFYAASRPIAPVSSGNGRAIVVLYRWNRPSPLTCGGGYVKLFDETTPAAIDGDSPYVVMFAPDVCGATNQIHLILRHNGSTHMIQSQIPLSKDSSVFALALFGNRSFSVWEDCETAREGRVDKDFAILSPEDILDPGVSKPDDWVDDALMDDPDDAKPSDWVDEVDARVVDPDAVRPDDWDEEEDGAWEPPPVANPAYKGVWTPRKLDNPSYQGEWVHPRIPNPEWSDDPTIGSFTNINKIGVELWQVEAGANFDGFTVDADASTLLERCRRLHASAPPNVMSAAAENADGSDAPTDSEEAVGPEHEPEADKDEL